MCAHNNMKLFLLHGKSKLAEIELKMSSKENSPRESPIDSLTCSLENDENSCSKCGSTFNQPKILTCLHVFCQSCLEKEIEEKEENEPKDVIVCPKCKQETIIPKKGIQELPIDHVTIDLLEMSAMNEMKLVCTSCKAKEKAVARCCDCASYLCENCVTAHQFMRCFDNHKVVKFDDMQDTETVSFHKPIFCASHPTEKMKFFCMSCQVPICNECMLADHKQPNHHYERITDIEESQRSDFDVLITECKSKVSACNEASSSLENSLSDLQMQRDDAKGLIQETFQTYRTVLEIQKEKMLEELENRHSCQELAIMELFHNVEKTSEKIEDCCTFAERVLKHGNGLQLLMMKKMIMSQLLKLINNTPKADVNVNIEFHTDGKVFQDAVVNSFGSFTKETPKQPERPSSSLHSSFENEGFNMPPHMMNDHSMMPPPMSSASYMSNNMSNNLLQETEANNMGLGLTNVGNFHNIGSSMNPPMHGAITGGTQSMVEGSSLSRSSHSPAMSDSGISVDAASNNSGSSVQPMFNNIAALAQMGSVGGFGGPSGSHSVTPITSSPDIQHNLLNPPTPRSQTPNLDALDRLVQNNPQPPIGTIGAGMSSVGTIGSNIGPIGSSSNMTSLSNIMTSSTGSLTSGSGMNSPGSSIGQYPPVRRSNKTSAMQIRCKFGQLGPGKGQFNSPHGFCLGQEENIVVADTNNHRIQCFEKTGEFQYQFGIPGREEGQLWYPRKVAVMRNSGKFVVCDRGNERSRMQIFTKNGHFVKKIAIRYIDIVAGLAITQQGHIVAVDSVSPTVFCITEAGDLLKWFDCSDYMREPSDIAISGKDYFVCDFKGHCVVVFNEEGHFIRRIGCENITNYPNGIDISDAGDVLIGDSHGNRFHVAVFQRDGSLIGEFECPYVKVSRCCGLKITSEGYVVTLAKNNHHVLVLNTLYIV
ncbi:B-box type zinc finger protein ncl-1-like isoform X2 [Mytilus edulis]|uniref:B-box type zinc finger protein ncl-1-like isoform X2 n=2 Tax=Mytilus edulis TaxID=6550 RepID=UPI0039EED4F4